MKKISLALVTLVVQLFASSSYASLSFEFGDNWDVQPLNHPDSAMAKTGAPDYGLRLNGYFLEDVSTKYTFDFEHPLSSLTLAKLGNQYTIEGLMYGGYTQGYETDYLPMTNGENSTAVWQLSYTLFDTGASCPASYEICLVGGNGTLTSSLGSFNLTGMANPEGTEFAFIDGFRNVDGLSAWGWVMWENLESGRTGKGDFMFLVGGDIPEVPIPASGVLLFSAISGLFASSGRKKHT